MDIVERLTLEAAQEDTMLAAEHRQRYELAAALCGGLEVVDLCCGSGYGSEILATTAETVLGVDRDAATIAAARAAVGARTSNVSFELADAVAWLEETAPAEHDAIVCFEGLEHLQDLATALARLRELTSDGGVRLIASVPNDQLFESENSFHATVFGYDSAQEAFTGFGSLVMLPQFLAEGSLILPEGAREVEVDLALGERHEPEYANHFIFCVGFDPEAVSRAHRGAIRLSAAPIFNRWSEDLKRGAGALRRENARLGRARLGKADAAAGSALARLTAREARVAELEEQARAAGEYSRELEEQLHRLRTASTAAIPSVGEESAPAPERDATPGGYARAIDASPRPLPAGEDSNSWEQRRLRAAEVMIPWIEQTFPLAGKTILEYGCGHGSVSCAFAERSKKVIGVDIDAAAIEYARQQARTRGHDNVRLEHHPLGEILAEVRAHRGKVDVFLLYAVLEHLTVTERLAVLELAREVVRPEGVIVVCETPNRLTYLDHHTAQMPFFHLLPDELAARAYARSARLDLKASLDRAAAEGEEELLGSVARWGRGVSFHEFELVFEPLERHVIASSYDPLLFAERPIHPEEVALARYLARVAPGLAPAFSRQWLDLILSPRPTEYRRAWMRPWSADTSASRGVGWTRWENLQLSGPEALLWVDLPRPTRRVVLGAVASDANPLALALHTSPDATPTAAVLRVPPPQAGYVEVDLAQPQARFAVTASAPCHLVLVAYEE